MVIRTYKTCKKCQVDQPIDNYYVHVGMRDGHLNICKDCTKTRVHVYRGNNLNTIRQYDRVRRLPENLTQEHKKSRAMYCKKWRESDKRRTHCHNMIYRYGKGHKPKNCSICGKETRIHGHHPDYDKPLKVVWCCQVCHKILERKEKKNEQLRNME